MEQKGGKLVNETLNPPSYIRRATGTGTRSRRTVESHGASRGGQSFQNMINYGNSRALVQVSDQRHMVPAIIAQSSVQAWGAEGTMLEG